MYRGDDVYLLDFWPLDEQNTLGAGITYEQGDHQTRFHLGVHRLNDPPSKFRPLRYRILSLALEMSPIWSVSAVS